MPGAIVLTRMPYWARSRAASRVIACTPPLEAGRVRHLPDLSLERRQRGGVDHDATLTGIVHRLCARHGLSGQPQNVKGTREIHTQHGGEQLDVMRPLAAQDPG